MNTTKPQFDESRYAGQKRDVYRVMKDRRWRTISEISACVWHRYKRSMPDQSTSARIRDLRKLKYGGYQIERRPSPTENSHDKYEYRLSK